MAHLLSVNQVAPDISSSSFLAPNCTISGDVVLGERCTVWFNTVIRGDVNSIRIGEETNIQDHAIIHCTYKKAKTVIGKRVSIGHRAVIHGCTLEDECLIGMGAIVLDRAVVQSNCLIAAGAVVLEGTICESGYLYAGIPARKIKSLTQDQLENIKGTARRYVEYATWYAL